jgi:hypothetical protein
MRTFAKLSRLAALAGVFALAVQLHAGEPAKAKTTSTTKNKKVVVGVVGGVAVAGSSTGILSEAYRLMASADHDYKGHRASAMRHVKTAAELIGQRVSGGRRGHEAQGTSDEQLRKAQSLLQEASGNTSGGAHQQVETAIHELSVALSVR